MKAFIVLTLLVLAGCKTVEYPEHFGKTDLPKIVKIQTDYNYHIQLPPRVQTAAYVWKYQGRVFFRSASIRPKTEIIRTEMYFPYPGRYVLEVHVEDPRGQLHIFKSIYLAEIEVSTYGRYIPQWIR
jgi:hypothetical protein